MIIIIYTILTSKKNCCDKIHLGSDFMNLNGESSKNKKTILNGKPLYGYDQAKKKNYFRHIQIHNKLTKQWRNNPGKLSKAQISNIVIRAVIIMFIILFVLSFL